MYIIIKFGIYFCLFLNVLINVIKTFSSLSTGLNTVAGTIYKDFLESSFSTQPSEKQASFILKTIVVLFGMTCVLLVFVFEKLGFLLEVFVVISNLTILKTYSLIFVYIITQIYNVNHFFVKNSLIFEFFNSWLQGLLE